MTPSPPDSEIPAGSEIPADPENPADPANVSCQSFSCRSFSCQECGACCAYSAEWPRFSIEDDADIARIPAVYVDDPAGRMRCEGDRCSALEGRVGERVACKVYAVRPEVCRTCEPGDPECLIARRRHGLPV